jgi:N-carbamoylputrescine amidase
MDGWTVRQMAELAQQLDVWLCVPLFEQDDLDPGRYFNAVAVFDPAGQIVARYRKRFIPNRRANEKYFFTPGDLPSPVWQVEDTRFGINICFERQFMETSRIPALKGADVLVHVTATWGDGSGRPNKGWFEQATAMARLNSLWVVAASATRVPGQPGPQGHSLIADPRGDLVATLQDEEGILVGEVDPLVARETRARTRILSEQRGDVLEELAACAEAAEARGSAGVLARP